MRRLALVIGLGAVGLLAGGCGTTSKSGADRPTGQILFTSGGAPAGFTAMVVAADGSGSRKLASDARDAVWSPDGRRIAFSRGNDIYVMAADGGSERRLTRDGDNEVPAWSPDGKLIAFVRCPTTDCADSAIYVMAADGSALRRLTTDPSLGVPLWSPDGKRIAIDEFGGFHVISVDGTHVLWRSAEDDYDPTWAPDGTKLAFTRVDSQNHADVYVISADGNGLRRVTDTPADAEFPAWSPDGKRIAFVEWRGRSDECEGRATISVVATEGGEVRHLAPYRYVSDSPAWSPDGKLIAFVGAARCDDDLSIYVVAAAGGEELRVGAADVVLSSSRLRWQPRL